MSSISFKSSQEVPSIIADYCDGTPSTHQKIRSIVMDILAKHFSRDCLQTLKPSSTQAYDYSRYILPSDYSPWESRGVGARPFRVFTYADDTAWVPNNTLGKERICGFFYLQNALKKRGVEKIKAAENRMAIVNGGIVYLSRYCGEIQPRKLEDQELSVLKDVGYVDINMGLVNLRRIGDTLYIFDTEKCSFDKRVHKEIDAFSRLHDAIQGTLEEQLKTWTPKERIVPPSIKELQDLWDED